MEQELFDVLSSLEMQAEREELNGVPESQRINALDPDCAKLISTLVMSKKAIHIVEIGSGVGYATLWLAYAASLTGGRVEAYELDSARAAQAQEHLNKAQMADYVTLHVGDACPALRDGTGPIDFAFIDGDFGQYETYFDALYKRMEVGAMLIADDVVESENELSDYVSYMQNHPNLESTTIPMGNGLELTVKTTV